MNLPLPALLIALPLALALITTVIGRWPRALVGVGVVSAAGLAVLALAAGSADVATWTVAGRAFELSDFNAQLLAMLWAGVAVLFALQWDRPGVRALVPGGLAALGLLAAALMVQPFVFGAVFLLAAVAVTVPALYGGRYAAANAAWGSFLAIALAVPLFVAAGWLLDAGQAGGDAAEIGLVLATVLLLGGFPFYIWITGIARTAPLPALALMLGMVGGGAAVWLAGVLALYPAGGATTFQVSLAGSVLLSVSVGAYGLSRATGFRDWLAYGLVIDAGMQIAALTTPGPAPAVVAVGALGRLVALLLLVAVADWAPAPEHTTAVHGRRVMMAFVGLALLGLPLTLSFSARWEALIALASQSPLILALVVLALGVAVAAGVRYALSSDQSAAVGAVTPSRRAAIPPGLLLIFALFMGLLSPYLLEYLARLSAG